MTNSSSDNIILPNPLKENNNSDPKIQSDINNILSNIVQKGIRPNINDWADYWYYIIGVNVIPVDTINREKYVTWAEWQNNSIPENLHIERKNTKKYSNGIALIPGKVWRGLNKDKNLVFIDLDNQKAIDEICNCFGAKDLEELSKYIIVEQHKDNTSKAHLYFYSEHQFKKKSSDAINFKDKIENNEIPGIEVKGQGEHGLAFCSPSIHKGGYPYEIIGTREPKSCGKKVEDILFQIYKKYDLNVNSNGKIPIEKLFDVDFKVFEGHNRHEALLRIMESLIQRNKTIRKLEQIKDIALQWNNQHCIPPLDERDFERQWEYALEFIEHKADPVSDLYDKYDNENIISISDCLRMHSGNIKVRGTIVSISKLYKMIKSVLFVCNSCGFKYPTKIFQIPVNQLKSQNKRCSNCNEKMEEECEYINTVKIEIQDSEKFSDIEKLSCILFDEYTKDIQIGSKGTVAASIQIIKQKNGKSIPCLYSSFIEYENKGKFVLADQDINAIQKFKKIKKGSVIESLIKMVAPSVIGLDIVKKGLLLSAVSTSEELCVNGQRERERIHVLLIGNPGIGKSKLISDCIELVPNSRYESSQHASGKSLTAIVSKEDEDYCLRTGPVPLARGAICVLNEIGRITAEDQGFLLDVMEEGQFTINKYGINSRITSPTVIVASTNPIGSENHFEEKINIDQIPLIKPVIDRFDLIFVLREPKDEDEIREYAEKKIEKLSNKIPNYYSYLKKHIAYAKQMKPELTYEAWSIIKEYYVKLAKKSNILSSSVKFGSRRTFDTLVRVAKSVSKLKLKNIVDAEDAKEALEFFNAVIYQYTESTIFIPGDPKHIAISAFTDILKTSSSTAYTIEEIAKKACEKDEYVKSYLLGNKKNYNHLLKLQNNRKLRNVYDLLIENSHIAIVKAKPVVLQWINSPASLSDTSDTYDKTNQKTFFSKEKTIMI